MRPPSDCTEYTFRRVRVVTEETTVALSGLRRDTLDAYEDALGADWELVSETGEDDIQLVGTERVLG